MSEEKKYRVQWAEDADYNHELLAPDGHLVDFDYYDAAPLETTARILNRELAPLLATIQAQAQEIEHYKQALQEIAMWSTVHLAPNPSRDEIKEMQALLYVRIRQFAKEALETAVKTSQANEDEKD